MQEIINMSLFDFFDLDNQKESDNICDELKINDKVSVEYNGNIKIGIVYSIYNNNETVNVVFDNKHTAFHISNIKKL